MNVRPSQLQPPRGLPPETARRRLTGDDLERMLRAGILNEDDRIELIDGEMVVMSPQGVRHEALKNELLNYWGDRRPGNAKFAVESPLRLSPELEPMPDLFNFPSEMKLSAVSGSTVLLVVEVADSSLSYDLDIKAPRYGAHGVRETWVIDARSLSTTVFRDPTPEGYESRVELTREDTLTPHLVPGLAVRLADLDPG